MHVGDTCVVPNLGGKGLTQRMERKIAPIYPIIALAMVKMVAQNVYLPGEIAKTPNFSAFGAKTKLCWIFLPSTNAKMHILQNVCLWPVVAEVAERRRQAAVTEQYNPRGGGGGAAGPGPCMRHPPAPPPPPSFER